MDITAANIAVALRSKLPVDMFSEADYQNMQNLDIAEALADAYGLLTDMDIDPEQFFQQKGFIE